jgi:isoamylase
MLYLTEGSAAVMGAVCTADGVNFALFSAHAERVELCLFDTAGNEQRFTLPGHTRAIWHGHIKGVGVGQHYGYRVYGPWAPADGHRFNPAKLLLDPYCRALTGPVQVTPAHFDHTLDTAGVMLISDVDSAPFQPRCIVVADEAAPAPMQEVTPLSASVLYEAHVKGFSRRNGAVPEALRGTYGGLGHEASVRHLQRLGVTAVELLPVHEFVDEPFVADKGLVNYWGYNSLCFFMPAGRYAISDGAAEFRAMVTQLHAAKLEVILDVVYNHSAEGDAYGPTLSFRGIDNRSYYRLNPDNAFDYVNESGCGNTLNVDHPAVLRLVLDSLRYWVANMGVDGFRFDLASSLARTSAGFSDRSAFFNSIHQDPLLANIKLIAEPWDLGWGGYQLGNYPLGWSEWNDQYRDTMRRYWGGEAGLLPDFARFLHGASNLFEAGGRPPQASVNFITSHDGFTLADLVSYEHKHNEANLENNRDGHDANYSFNCGVEGFTDDPQVLRLRRKQQRNLLTTLFLSQGMPMLLAGDEMSRTKAGNNNSYCQDNGLNWLDWQHADQGMIDFVAELAALRRDYREFRCERFIHGRAHEHFQGIDEIEWFHASGQAMQAADWDGQQQGASVGLMLHGEMLFDDASANLVFVFFHASAHPGPIVLPKLDLTGVWQPVLTSALDALPACGQPQGAEVRLEDQAVYVFRFNGEPA